MKKRIVVLPYDPGWANSFNRFKKVFEENAGKCLMDIQHVGSTSVPGLAAKPIIDIDLIVEDRENMQRLITALEKLGYRHVGDQGITGREAFKRDNPYVPNTGDRTIWPDHHLYACIKGAPALLNHLSVRDYLRRHAEAAQAYGALKKSLAEKYPYDIDAYVEKKTAFLIGILEKTDFPKAELTAIIQQNKAR